MGRLIDADALWMDVIHRMDYCDDILEMIEAMPTVEPEQKWIPCSERLPEKRTDVLVTRTFEGCEKIKPKTYVEIAEIAGDEWIAVSDEFKFGRHTDPVAWMPLPEPYRKEKVNR